jgi:hypothetical protein
MAMHCRLSRLSLIVIVLSLGAWTSALADECPIDGLGTCHAEFAELAAITAVGVDGFAAVGTLREPAAPGLNSGVLRFRPGGTTELIAVEPPANPRAGDRRPINETEARSLVLLRDGDLVAFGTVRFGEAKDLANYGWAARIDKAGKTKWSVAYAGGENTDFIFHFGRMLPNGDLIAGGRIQNGPGDAKCTNWSRGVVAWIDPDTGRLSRPLVPVGDPRGRMALYSAVALPDSRLLFTGFESVKKGGGLCQDQILWLTTSASGAVADMRTMPAGGSENEIGQDLELLDTRAVVAGMTHGGSDFAATVIAVPRDAKEKVLKKTFSRGHGGRNRFFAITQDPVSRNYVAVGYSSEDKEARYKAWWYTLGKDDLSVVEEGRADQYVGSGLNGVAALPNGRVLAVGYARAEDGSQYGWSLAIKEGIRAGVQVGSTQRPVDKSLRPLAVVPQAEGAYALGALTRDPAGFFMKDLARDQRIKADFNLPRQAPLRIVLHPQGGDVDILLSRLDGTAVDFSNYRGDATEVIEEAGASGSYRLEIIAQTDVPAFDLTFDIDKPLATLETTAANREVAGETRLMLRAIMAMQGYFPGAEPEVALSPETIRAFIALQDATAEAVTGIIGKSPLVASLIPQRDPPASAVPQADTPGPEDEPSDGDEESLDPE